MAKHSEDPMDMSYDIYDFEARSHRDAALPSRAAVRAALRVPMLREKEGAEGRDRPCCALFSS